MVEIPIRKQMRQVSRLATIVNTFARHGFWSVIKKIELGKNLNTNIEQPKDIALDSLSSQPFSIGLRRAFEELGPAFIKLGQILAVREDLIPYEYTEELRKLHNNVDTLPFSEMKRILTDQLGEVKLDEFEWIDENALAAGSIAQVHRARLKTGEEVVIKIQRPDIEQDIVTDLSLIESVAGTLEKYIPEIKNIKLQQMITSLAQGMILELDFIREAGAMTKIANNLASFEFIKIPAVFWNLTTKKVLTLSYLPGVPSWDLDSIHAKNLVPGTIVERGLKMFLKMVFVDGMFHGDLHPGNLLIADDGSVIVLDFGLTIKIGRWTRENLAALLTALVQEDYERMVQHFLEITEPSPTLNVQAFQSEIANRIAPFVGLRLRQINSARVLWDLAKVAAKHGAPVPQDLVVFIKTLASFEGLGAHLDPDFDIMATCQEFSAEILETLYSTENLQYQALSFGRDMSSLAKHTPILLRKLLTSANDGHLKFQLSSDEIKRVAKSIERASSRMAVSIIIAALLIGSSILTFVGSSTQLQSIPIIGLSGFGLAGILALYVILSILM